MIKSQFFRAFLFCIFLFNITSASWKQMPKFNSDDLEYFSVTHLYYGQNALYAQTPGGVWYYTSDAVTWKGPLSITFTYLPIVHIDSTYFMHISGSLICSTDSFAHQKDISSALGGKYVNTLVVYNKVLFAGTKSGVIKSIDYGASWKQVGDGLNNLNALSLVVTTKYLFAGVENGGVWYLPIEEATPVINPKEKLSGGGKSNRKSPGKQIVLTVSNKGIPKCSFVYSLSGKKAVSNNHLSVNPYIFVK